METVMDVFTQREQILFDLLFSDKKVILIELDNFCEYKDRTKFKEEIRTIIKIGKVEILDDRIVHTNESVLWKLEVKR